MSLHLSSDPGASIGPCVGPCDYVRTAEIKLGEPDFLEQLDEIGGQGRVPR
jgi:hypothetical protein